MEQGTKNISALFIISAVIAVIIAAMIQMNLKSRLEHYPFEHRYDEKLGEFSNGMTISQRFTARDDFSLIKIKVAAPDKKRLRGEWIFSIADAETKRELDVRSVDISGFKGDSFVRVCFGDLPGVKGKMLNLLISSFSKKGESASVYLNSGKIKGDGLIFNGETQKGSLVFYTYGDISVFELLKRATQFKPGFIKGVPFFALFFLSLFSFALVCVYFLKHFSKLIKK